MEIFDNIKVLTEILMQNYVFKLVLFAIACFLASFFNTANSRTKNSDSMIAHAIFGIIADAAWLFLFKDLISKDTLGIGFACYPIYIVCYRGGAVVSQYVFMRFAKGGASVGGIDILKNEIKNLQNQVNLLNSKSN